MTTAVSTEPVLQVRDFTVEFWVDGVWYPAAVNMNFDLQPGRVLAIVGESGSGKSTTGMGLTNLLATNARTFGSVKVKGTEMIGASKSTLRKVRGRDVAYIFQEPMTAMNPVYTIGFQIVETLRNHFDMSPAEAKKRAIELITMVEIPNPARSFDKYPHQLSGGQRQRAMIAQALACDPALLVADEPTTALDVTVQAEILDLMRGLRDKLNSAILLITHDMGVVADLADEILVMKDGLTVEHGSAEKIFNRPQQPYTQQLLGSVPKLGASTKRELVVTGEAAKIPVLKIDNVTIEYPKRGRIPAFTAVEDFSLEIYPGEIVGLVGESGSGKTTVGRASIGLLPVKAGSVQVAGKEIAGASLKDLRQIRRHTGIVFQDPASSLNPRLPIGESIGEPLLLAGEAKGAELNRIVEDLLDKVELPRSYRNRYPHELSGGQRQRVGIARALALTPDLLIADEPTSALDVSVQARFLELLQELQEQLKFACLFISHDLAVVDILSHRIAVMQNGRLVEVGDRDAILRNPKDPYTQRLIAAVPVPDPAEQAARRAARVKTSAIPQAREATEDVTDLASQEAAQKKATRNKIIGAVAGAALLVGAAFALGDSGTSTGSGSSSAGGTSTAGSGELAPPAEGVLMQFRVAAPGCKLPAAYEGIAGAEVAVQVDYVDAATVKLDNGVQSGDLCIFTAAAPAVARTGTNYDLQVAGGAIAVSTATAEDLNGTQWIWSTDLN